MSETWTEYALRWPDGEMRLFYDTRQARSMIEYHRETSDVDLVLLGRTVTASDWLPVDTDGAK